MQNVVEKLIGAKIDRYLFISVDGVANLKISSDRELLDKAFGLSLSDQYWLKPYNLDINYNEINFFDNDFDYEKIEERVKQGNIKLIEIQRSKGYSTRESLGIEKLEKVISIIKSINKDIIIMIDNCYCEFVERKTPLEAGADIIVGSLIKNLGGGIAPNGAYIAGRKDLVDFTIPYYDAAQKLVVKADNTEFDACTDAAAVEAILNAKDSSCKIGVQNGTTGYFFVAGDADWGFDGFAAKCVTYKNGSLAVQDMLNGRIQYVVIDAAPATAITEAMNAIQ